RPPELVADGRDSRRAWLYTVARNLIIDRSRSRGCRPPETDDAVLPSIPDPTCAIDRVLTSLALREALTRLTAAQREVLVELYYRDRSPNEIAAALGIPVGTVKSRAHSAVRALRAELTGARPIRSVSEGSSRAARRAALGTPRAPP